MSLSNGTSSETLHPSPSTPPSTAQEDQWSDAHETLETDDERDMVDDLPQRQDDLTIRPQKVTSPSKSLEIRPSSPVVQPESIQHEHVPPEPDATSVRSVPVVQVTEPTSPTPPLSARSTSSTYPSASTSSLTPAGTPSRNRNRAVMEGRASNRISGFFSALIHRRENPPTPTRDQTAPSEPSPLRRSTSRPSSPLPSRPATPPPPLPRPTLDDLGLNLASLTAHLSPAHFSSPPSSGAFLSPNYLLLCHAQGLDVVPLTSPPVTQPYTLIRRVPFKSVVVMEHRGVLVAIAGRRDGVRVYALEEVRRAIEWRMDVEIRRERERVRREEVKRALAADLESKRRGNADKDVKPKLFQSVPPASTAKDKSGRRTSVSVITPAPSPGIPRTPTIKRSKAPTRNAQPTPVTPSGPPPAYSPPMRMRENSTVAINPMSTRARTTSVNDVLAGTINRRVVTDEVDRDEQQDDSKADWASSDEEAIDPVAAPSGSQALDERTSSVAASASPTTPNASGSLEVPMPTLPRMATTSSIQRRNRPANLELNITRTGSAANGIVTEPPSPTPTLLSLRQALQTSPGSSSAAPTRRTLQTPGGQGQSDADEEDDDIPVPSSPTTPTRERISLAEALFESRRADVPPAGTRQPQEAILLSTVASGDEGGAASPRTSESASTFTRRSTGDQTTRRRRRWSVLDGIFTPSSSVLSQSSVPSVNEAEASSSGLVREEVAEVHTDNETRSRTRTTSQVSRAQSARIQPSPSTATVRPATSVPSSILNSGGGGGDTSDASGVLVPPPLPPLPASSPPSRPRFIPRIITNAFSSRRSEDRPSTPKATDSDSKKQAQTPMSAQAPAPKLEYVKLPGTKGSVMVKSVETAKKSFLAILCGENGEKVELFAGTYRTALGLSRTFILPDSPRSLELQLQGDDLVEVFLVFSQNVFGLEPATVRVREVRIGRAERRAARRRARENRTDQAVTDAVDADNQEEDTAVNVTIGVAVTPAPPNTEEGALLPASSSTPSPGIPTQASESTPITSEATNATDELLTLATAQMSSYTTFQQLSFAPKFPLATISDDYVIPPTYPSFLEYRGEYEPEINGSPNVDLAQVQFQFNPPGLPVPTPAPPSKWFYRDPKGQIHGPWKASLMQAWYQDGLLPPELPVRREEDDDYILLKDLRTQCVDPTRPFRSTPPPPETPPPVATPQPVALVHDPSKPLLKPISLLSQPKHFGPPALFFSSRGGHSTTIVDARGRSVLKGRFLWSTDDSDDDPGLPRLGDVKRLEAFDVQDRAVLVAMRQGGLEVVDFGDALFKPADNSRTLFPHFNPPTSAINRRGPFVWKIGTPISPSLSSSSLPSLPTKFPAHRLHGKKQSTGPTKSPGRPDFSLGGDTDSEHPQDEVLFLGRKDDEIYLCERRTGSFRILRLSPRIL